MAHSPRAWARALKQHLIDHGGGRIMASIMSPEDAMVDGYNVFMADDTTSFLRAGFVSSLQQRNIAVVGVYQPTDGEGSGRRRLLDLQVDEIIEADASQADFVRVISRAAATAAAGPGDGLASLMTDLGDPGIGRSDPYGAIVGERGRQVVVAGAAGGVGASEIAIGLACSLTRRNGRSVLLDADDIGPSVTQRLGLDIHPNIRTAIDALHNRVGQIDEVLIEVPAGGFDVLGGVANRRDWFELRPGDVTEVVLELAQRRRHVIVNVSSRLEDLPAIGGPPRYGVSRAMVALADVVILVASGTPLGVTRVFDWIAEAQTLIEATPLIVVFNGFRGGAYETAEIEEELRSVYQPKSIVFVPFDGQLTHASWQGVLPKRGPFSKAMDHLGSLIVPSKSRSSRVRRAG
jgi:MinD-like ATPase involved in chromosome partitioning or flagellar assembly